ncbi:MAG: hypothetical protein ACO1OY_03555 [Ramlibacter sp.]
MSFLHQLKTQAKALQAERVQQEQDLTERTSVTEKAGRLVLGYLQDLARQLTVIEPDGPAFSLDGKTPWPAMKLTDFRADARRKPLRDREVLDYIAMGWLVVPRIGVPVGGVVSVNFPTDMRRVEDRLMMGPVKHERREIRDPEKKNALKEVRYEYITQTRGSVTATLDHDHAQIHFRLLNTAGFEVVQATVPAVRMAHSLLDELAKRIVGQPSTFP